MCFLLNFQIVPNRLLVWFIAFPKIMHCLLNKFLSVFENLKNENVLTNEFCHSSKKKKNPVSKLLAGTLLYQCGGLMLVH